MSNVRLSVIIASEGNKIRTSTHADVPLSKVAEQASKLAGRMAGFHKAEKKAEERE